MKYKGTVVETLTIEKTVEIEVPEGADEYDIRAALEAKAYETRLEETGGWEFADVDPHIDVDNIEKIA